MVANEDFQNVLLQSTINKNALSDQDFFRLIFFLWQEINTSLLSTVPFAKPNPSHRISNPDYSYKVSPNITHLQMQDLRAVLL